MSSELPPGPPREGEEAVQGSRRYARSHRSSRDLTTFRPLPTVSGGGSSAQPFSKSADKRSPSEKTQLIGLAFLIPGFVRWCPVSCGAGHGVLGSCGPCGRTPTSAAHGPREQKQPLPHAPEPRLLLLPLRTDPISLGTANRCHRVRMRRRWCERRTRAAPCGAPLHMIT
jgi:hypothetical protein